MNRLGSLGADRVDEPLKISLGLNGPHEYDAWPADHENELGKKKIPNPSDNQGIMNSEQNNEANQGKPAFRQEMSKSFTFDPGMIFDESYKETRLNTGGGAKSPMDATKDIPSGIFLKLSGNIYFAIWNPRIVQGMAVVERSQRPFTVGRRRIWAVATSR